VHPLDNPVLDNPVLDNPAWHALHGPHVTLAERLPLAARYRPDVAPFAALPDDPAADAWDDLRTLVGPGHVAVLFRAAAEVPPAWEVLFRIDAVQMVLDQLITATGSVPARIEALADGDVPAMMDLVSRTRPGPFLPRTIELGTYLGIKLDGALVAMAGERMRLDGHTEVSAVCTDPAFRGRGFAAALVRAAAGRAQARGHVPFLHVAVTNEPAIKLYDSLGFSTRRSVDAIGARVPG
jgi:ribosomal protein S18 acetylase RimI-like enzyme